MVWSGSARSWGPEPGDVLSSAGAAPAQPPRAPAKRGPKTSYTDEALTSFIRQVLAASPFLGEGHRKVWARLRVQGIRTSQRRVLRLMRQAGLLAPSRAQRTLGPRVHDGTIVTERPNQMWGTDATSTVTLEDGPVTVFVAVDHCTLEGVGIHAAKTATRFEALEPLRQGVRRQFRAVTAGIAAGLQVRHDHGGQYLSDDFQAELRFLGITSSPAFVRGPARQRGSRNGSSARSRNNCSGCRHSARSRSCARRSKPGWSRTTSSGWWSAMGSARRPTCAAPSWRRRRRHDEAAGPRHRAD
ncbi:MAG: hypothetical protein KatS3mg082_1839 [Nitrospiraceae bacterium]|nr:MAG: hypothetical protein KatS3mg082_1839 [Nitrospiraceae bacterium]